MKYVALIPFLLLTAAAAWFGAQFEPGAWHAALAKPAWNPPNAVFAPVWTVLYILIAIAGWRVWLDRAHPNARIALALWFTQLALNAAWSWLFFGLHRISWALVDIIALATEIAAFIVLTWRSQRMAALLFVPYFAWVAFAAALNAAIWALHRGG